MYYTNIEQFERCYSDRAQDENGEGVLVLGGSTVASVIISLLVVIL